MELRKSLKVIRCISCGRVLNRSSYLNEITENGFETFIKKNNLRYCCTSYFIDAQL